MIFSISKKELLILLIQYTRFSQFLALIIISLYVHNTYKLLGLVFQMRARSEIVHISEVRIYAHEIQNVPLYEHA